MRCNAPVTRNVLKRGLLVWLLSIISLPAQVAAQVVSVCDVAVQTSNIADPEDLNIRNYANGNVLIAVVDDGRPNAAKALSVLIISPPLDSHGQRQCRLVSHTPSSGYAALILNRAEATYDPAIGLTVSFPGVVMATLDSLGERIDLAITINQATGMITPIQTNAAE